MAARRQMLIDTYAEGQKKKEIEKERQNDDAEAESLKYMKKGAKFVTPFWEQTWVLGKHHRPGCARPPQRGNEHLGRRYFLGGRHGRVGARVLAYLALRYLNKPRR
jgi:hypothetical protein